MYRKRATEGRDTAFRFHLTACVISGNDDVTCQGHFDTNRKADALYGSDDRFAADIA